MTAVQELKYLFDDILKDRGVVITWDTYIEQEKQQIIDAYMDRMDITDKEYFKQIIGVEYYNKTYKQDI